MYSTGIFAKMIKRCSKTLQRWDKEGILKPEFKSPKGRRLYSHKQYLEYFNLNKNETKKIIAYCRVSSSSQQNDLKSQINFVKEFMFNKGEIINEVYTDIGSGLNYKRKNFLKLIDEINQGLIKEIIIAHKDRLVRFGFELIEHICEENNVILTVINDEKLSPNEEMSKDLISIIHVFSSRFYGLRKYKKILNETCKEN